MRCKSPNKNEHHKKKKKPMVFLSHSKMEEITSDFVKSVPIKYFEYLDEYGVKRALLPFQIAVIKRMISMESPIVPCITPVQTFNDSEGPNPLNLVYIPGGRLEMFLRLAILVLPKGCCKTTILIKMIEITNALYHNHWVQSIENDSHKKNFYINSTRQNDYLIITRNESTEKQYHLVGCTIVITNSGNQWKQLIQQQKSGFEVIIFEANEMSTLYYKLIDSKVILVVPTSEYTKLHSILLSYYQNTILVPFRLIFDDHNLNSNSQYIHSRFIWIVNNDDISNSLNNRKKQQGIIKDLYREVEANYLHCTVSMNLNQINQEIMESLSPQARESKMINIKVKDRLDLKAFNARYICSNRGSRSPNETNNPPEDSEIDILLQLGISRIIYKKQTIEQYDDDMVIKFIRGQIMKAEEDNNDSKVKELTNRITEMKNRMSNKRIFECIECPICYNEVTNYKVAPSCCQQVICVTCTNRQLYEKEKCPFCRESLLCSQLNLYVDNATIEPHDFTINPFDALDCLIKKHINDKVLIITNSTNDKYYCHLRNNYDITLIKWKNEIKFCESVLALTTDKFPSSGYSISQSFDVIILTPSYQLQFNMKGLFYFYPYNVNKKLIYQLNYY